MAGPAAGTEEDGIPGEDGILGEDGIPELAGMAEADKSRLWELVAENGLVVGVGVAAGPVAAVLEAGKGKKSSNQLYKKLSELKIMYKKTQAF